MSTCSQYVLNKSVMQILSFFLYKYFATADLRTTFPTECADIFIIHLHIKFPILVQNR